MKRILFFDVDGTISIPGKGPSRETVQAIRSARAAVHKVFLSTGQSIAYLTQYMRLVLMAGYTVLAATSLTDGKVILDCPMAPDMKEKIIMPGHETRHVSANGQTSPLAGSLSVENLG